MGTLPVYPCLCECACATATSPVITPTPSLLTPHTTQESNDTIRASIKAARNQQQSLTQTRCSEQEAFLVAAKQLDQEVDALLAAATSLKPPPAGTTGVAADGALTPQVGSPGAAGGPAESDMVLLADVTAAGGVMSGVGHGSSSSGLLLGETEVQLLPGMEGSPQSQQQQVMLGGLAAGSPPAAGSLADHHLMAAEAVGAEGGMGESQGTGLGSQHLAATGDSQGQDMAGEVGASQKMLQLAGAVEAEEDDVCRGSDQSASQVTV
jgi:hypothetical protein